MALAGEVGELCNLLRKREEGGDVAAKSIEDELADVFTYLDLLAARLHVRLDLAVVRKFNEVSERRGVDITLDIAAKSATASYVMARVATIEHIQTLVEKAASGHDELAARYPSGPDREKARTLRRFSDVFLDSELSLALREVASTSEATSTSEAGGDAAPKVCPK